MSEPAQKSAEVFIPPSRVIYGAPEGHDARILAEKARALTGEDRIVLHVALDDARAVALQGLLGFFAPDVRVIYFPAWDCLPYDRISPHGDIVAQRVAALCGLVKWQKDAARYPRLLLTTINAVAQRVTPQSALQDALFDLKAGALLDQDKFRTFLQGNGYLRGDTVREAGEYAFRGSIVDIFPAGHEEPLRIDLFGDEIESIRSFDPSSQRSGAKLPGAALYPATELFLDPDSMARFRANYRALFGVVQADDPLYNAVSEGRRYSGMEHWQALFFERLDTIFDYAPGAAVTFDQHAVQSHIERVRQVQDFYQARRTLEQAAGAKRGRTSKGTDVSLGGAIYHPAPVESLYLTDSEWKNLTEDALHLSPFGGPGESADSGARRGRDFSDVRAKPGGDVFSALAEYAAARRSEGKKLVVAAYSEGSRARLRGLMEHAGFANLKDVGDAEGLKKLETFQTGLAVLGLENGFVAADLAVVTEQDILGDRLARRAAKRRRADNFLTEVSSLAPGDLVVHVDHGIGRFEGLETLKVMKTLHDCLKLEYAGGDRLYVPVENIDILTRFGSDEGIVQLDRLGGAGWQARKAKVKEDLLRMADGLLKIAAARHVQKGQGLQIDNEQYQEFSARFPWQETEDQQRSIQDVLDDIASERPMDRLVCGDVGFGKTEVALRAAYVAAMSGAQVAVAVPTTLLARQHYQNFTARVQGTGLRVEQLSRLVPETTARKTREGLADGSVSIVVGTHALFAGQVKFAQLGLLVVDEEQRFGVKQKERLKELKANVHVLTLTATPIPRTLQMALAGVRDLSLIATPPVDRLAIRTFALPFDPVIVREALLREHYRGGQSFYVCPRIADIEEVEALLKELVPEVKVIMAHGQMGPADLEDRMSAFYDGQYDVLLATNIIESGLDIPRANTMIVHRADLFGLAQLYQIRGRIGRSKVRAYAYLTWEPHKILTPEAQKRLEVIETLDTLGAGFQLASHDMDIRGAGNLLGEEQSGHIKEVGVELYQQMLEEAVAATREGLDWTGGALADKWSPQINIGMSILIPEHYVEDLSVRMSLYRRLSDLETKQDIESFAAELIDRFGKLPEEVENLLRIMEIRQLCRRAGVDRVEAGPRGAVLGFYKDTPPQPAAVMKWIADKGRDVRLRPDQKLVLARTWEKTGQRVAGIKGLIEELARLAGP